MDFDQNDIVDFEEDDFSESEIRMLEEVEEKALEQKADSSASEATPFERYRALSHGYLSVSNLVSQLWCEQQLEYSFTAPKPKPTEAIQKGTDMHLARELELYDIVDIKIETEEDNWAIKFLNSYPKILQLGQGCKVRELPVLGDPYRTGIFIYGIIDEINYTACGKLELCELKSRNGKRTLPSVPQQRKTELQVSLYKKLFDDLVMGKLQSETITVALNIEWNHLLSEEPLQYAKDLGLHCTTLRDVLDVYLMAFQYSDIPTISAMTVEYCSQTDFAVIQKQEVFFDQEKLDRTMNKLMAYWTGGRSAEGVDIEEAWKCHNCEFVQDCLWRKRKEEECRNRNVLKDS